MVSPLLTGSRSPVCVAGGGSGVAGGGSTPCAGPLQRPVDRRLHGRHMRERRPYVSFIRSMKRLNFHSYAAYARCEDYMESTQGADQVEPEAPC